MPGGGQRVFNCVLCQKRTKAKERRPVNSSINKYLSKNFHITASATDVICNKCRHKYYLSETKKQPTASQDDSADKEYLPSTSSRQPTISSPPSIQLKIPSTPKSHARCFCCKKPGSKLIIVPSKARLSAFIEQNILIPAGSRCCPSHILTSTLAPETLSNRTSILDLLNAMRNACAATKEHLCFETLKAADYPSMTGLSKSDFDDLYHSLDGKIRNTPARSVRTTLGIFLLKLKAGISNKILSTICGLSRSSLRRGIASVRQILMVWFVPQNLGLAHMPRAEVIERHTRPLAKSLFGTTEGGDRSTLILVLDGTYIYVQKSNNFMFQRRSYSVHKGRPLVKPMVVVTTTGYYLTIVGPYMADARNNDARILNHMLRTNVEDIKSYVESEDVFIVDRGFRDSISLLEDMGIKAEMPAFMVKGQKQMCTEDANSSRLVTKIRWVVESANARIKRWKFMDKVLPTNQIPYIGDYIRIICAISNKYLPPLSGSDTVDDDQVATVMRNQLSRVNSLKSYIESENIERRPTVWKSVTTEHLENFPRLNEDHLRSLTCGVYQLKLSPCYIQEHLDGGSDIQVHIEDDNLIRIRMQSRHTSSKKYLLWIRFNQAEILAWYCKCRAGARVVGVCSHIAAILWFLGYARHRYIRPEALGVRNWGVHLTDASNIPETIDESDSESGCSDTD